MRQRTPTLVVVIRGFALAGVALAIALSAGCAEREPDVAGRWHAWLESAGGELPFTLEIERRESGLAAFVVNGDERADVPHVEQNGDTILFRFDHFDSAITARLDPARRRMQGDWRRTAGPAGEQSHLVFHAEAAERPRFAADGIIGDPTALAGRWAVDFATDDDPSVGVFAVNTDGAVIGTFMNTMGDYRFLAGDFRGQQLRLSTFDGAHAFLFRAEIADDGTMRGDFWSRDKWHETWTARRDDGARLPDAFELTRVGDGVTLNDLVYPDLDGTPRALDDPAFSGRARLLFVFGSWCPNCNDATDYLVDLHARYRDRGLAILGLAFEMTGDFARDAEQVRTYMRWHAIDYPVLLAGRSDKAEASRSFPLIDRVRSFPTILFVDREGSIRAVHQGFSGPATGAAYDALRERFEVLIEELLS